jgi:hypothetical protein
MLGGKHMEPQSMSRWNVRRLENDKQVLLGRVNAYTPEQAREEAISRFSIASDQLDKLFIYEPTRDPFGSEK